MAARGMTAWLEFTGCRWEAILWRSIQSAAGQRPVVKRRRLLRTRRLWQRELMWLHDQKSVGKGKMEDLGGGGIMKKKKGGGGAGRKQERRIPVCRWGSTFRG